MKLRYTVEKNETYAFVDFQQTQLEIEDLKDFKILHNSLFVDGYFNIILNLGNIKTLLVEYYPILKKIHSLCLKEQGLFVLVAPSTEVEKTIENMVEDITIISTVEEAIEAVYENERENEFSSAEDSGRDEDEDDPYEGGGGSPTQENENEESF